MQIPVVDLIPLITGGLIFISVLLAGGRKFRREAWALGLISQLLLITFGILTHHFTFTAHVPVALAFAYNLWRSFDVPRPIRFPVGGTTNTTEPKSKPHSNSK